VSEVTVGFVTGEKPTLRKTLGAACIFLSDIRKCFPMGVRGFGEADRG